MTPIKSYTDLEQSKRLVEILPIESADICYVCGNTILVSPTKYGDTSIEELYKKHIIPAWSLAALLNYLKSKNKFPEIKELSDGRFKLTTYIWDGEDCIQVSIGDSIIDACYELILKLYELNLL